MKGRSYEDIYGPEKAAELRAMRRNKAKESKLGSRLKGKSYLEIHGESKTKELKQVRAKQGPNLTKNLKGKTYEEFYGEKKAKELKKLRSKSRGGLHLGFDRGKNWNTQRKKALKRDNYRCQDCGVKARLDVHHLIPYRFKKSNALKGLISLCRSCHFKWDRKWRKENRNSLTQPQPVQRN